MLAEMKTLVLLLVVFSESGAFIPTSAPTPTSDGVTCSVSEASASPRGSYRIMIVSREAMPVDSRYGSPTVINNLW